MEYKKVIDAALVSFFKKWKTPKTARIIFDNIKEFVLRDGKRIRPTLLLLSYEGYKKNKDYDLQAMQLAVSLELLHAFFLIHDDVMDQSDLRRGLPTFHKSLCMDSKTAESVAICAGDILFSCSCEVFFNTALPESFMVNLRKHFFAAIMQTGAGQAQDVMQSSLQLSKISEAQLLETTRIKTSLYTIHTPLVLGAMLAGAPLEEYAKLTTLSNALGVAFQLQDDVLGLFGDEKVTGKSIMSDIMEGKKTLLIKRAWQMSSAKSFIVSSLGNKDLSKKDILQLQKEVKSSGALDSVEQEIQTLTNTSQSVLRQLSLKNQQKDAFRQIMDALVKRKR